MNLVDSHSHLTMLKHDELEKIMERAAKEGVIKFVSVSTEEANFESNRDVALAHENVWYSLGVHPHEAKDYSKCEGKLKGYFTNGRPPKKCVAVGEIGLDFHYNHSKKETQLKVLEDQILWAHKVGLPIILHCRDSFSELYSILRRLGTPPKGGVMHCFTGGKEEAKEAVDLGLKISFSGIVTFKNAEKIREAAKTLSPSDILIETDCPYLAPIPLRGKPNEPSYLHLTLRSLAETRGEKAEELASKTTENAVNLFRLE